MLDEGQICMSLVGSSPIATAQLRGSKMELIGMLDVIGDAERLVVKEHIVSPMDLEGKTLVTVTGEKKERHGPSTPTIAYQPHQPPTSLPVVLLLTASYRRFNCPVSSPPY